MRILITGANGFVGSFVTEALCTRPGVQVACLVRRRSNLRWIAHLPVELVYGDVTDPASLAQAVRECEMIIHTAGLVKARRRREFFHVNAQGTKNLIAAALRHAPRLRRFVYVSSQAAAGPAHGPFPLTEDSPCRPLNSYGASKRRGEQWLQRTPPRFSWTVVRPCAVYGPRDTETLAFVRMARRGWFPIPRTQSAGGGLVALIHARDLAAAILAAADSPAAHRRIYFATDGLHYRWETLCQELERSLGVHCRRLSVPAPVVHAAGLIAEIAASFSGRAPMLTREKALEITAPFWMCSSERLQNDTGWRPRITLPDGLRETVRWYEQQGWL
ncbi:MAG: NAD-dependent epimerase/dehydratase family protein [Candidatus Sumerlaeia bacterium]